MKNNGGPKAAIVYKPTPMITTRSRHMRSLTVFVYTAVWCSCRLYIGRVGIYIIITVQLQVLNIAGHR